VDFSFRVLLYCFVEVRRCPIKRLVFIVLPVVFFFLLSSPGLAQLSTFFDLLSQTPRFLTPECTSDTLSRYGETVLFPMLDVQKRELFLKLGEEFQKEKKSLKRTSVRKTSSFGFSRRIFPA